jgi:hypothetical protein
MPQQGYPRRGLGATSLEVLRLCEPALASHLWRDYVLALCARYSHVEVKEKLRQLRDGGFIHDEGSPRTGWLTTKGKRALRRQES